MNLIKEYYETSFYYIQSCLIAKYPKIWWNYIFKKDIFNFSNQLTMFYIFSMI